MNVGIPMADPRKQIMADLERQINAFMVTGEIQQIPPGASAEAPHFGTTGRTLKLRMKRDMHAQAVAELVAKGEARKDIAKALGLHVDTVALIIKENGITQPGPP
jgi:DNA-binding NarL/FixJ family response regulator